MRRFIAKRLKSACTLAVIVLVASVVYRINRGAQSVPISTVLLLMGACVLRSLITRYQYWIACRRSYGAACHRCDRRIPDPDVLCTKCRSCYRHELSSVLRYGN